MSESYRRVVESLDEKMSREIVQLIDEKQYTGEEIREAYYQLCGASDQTEMSERVGDLKLHMERMTGQGYPLNRLAALVTAVDHYEDAIPEFEQFVATMAISEKEKNMLVSIVENTREGKLECHADDEHVATIEIRDLKSPAALARLLKEKIGEVINGMQGKKVNFWFEEV